ncbi:helix-turn-helix transcriptional regulator [Vibrio alginolyticus]|uniref:AraC family transcriptional regulator n=1 Tax=Vibrio alginolyticus TaxID=663 RepID=UPI003750F074
MIVYLLVTVVNIYIAYGAFKTYSLKLTCNRAEVTLWVMKKNCSLVPFQNHIPEPMYFRVAEIPANSSYPNHSHPWGEFVYSYNGVMEVRIGRRSYLAPSQYGIWLPPGIEHQGFNQYEATHYSLYIEPSYANALPNKVCALQVTPLVRSALEHLKQFLPVSPYSDEQTRLIRVIYDQLKQTNSIESFLPSTDDATLSRVLDYIENHLDQDIPLKTLAAHFYVTERTLMRKSNKELGMPLTEWKQKLKVLKAMNRLEVGDSVEVIALELGYSSSSAFIAMFKRIMGVTPKEYVKMNV